MESSKMTFINSLVTWLDGERYSLERFSRYYERVNDERAQVLKIQHELLSEVLAKLGCKPHRLSHKSIAPADMDEPLHGRVSALLTDETGHKNVTLFETLKEAESAWAEFLREIERIEAYGITSAYEWIDIDFLSADLLSQRGPHIVYALVTEVFDRWRISLHHEEDEAWAVFKRLRIEEDEALEAGEIWVGVSAVALPPNITQMIIEDICAWNERRARLED